MQKNGNDTNEKLGRRQKGAFHSLRSTKVLTMAILVVALLSIAAVAMLDPSEESDAAGGTLTLDSSSVTAGISIDGGVSTWSSGSSGSEIFTFDLDVPSTIVVTGVTASGSTTTIIDVGLDGYNVSLLFNTTEPVDLENITITCTFVYLSAYNEIVPAASTGISSSDPNYLQDPNTGRHYASTGASNFEYTVTANPGYRITSDATTGTTTTDTVGLFTESLDFEIVTVSANVTHLTTVQQVYKVTVPVATGYSVDLSYRLATLVGVDDGFRGVDVTDPANPFAYVDVGGTSQIKLDSTMSAGAYYRIADLTTTDPNGLSWSSGIFVTAGVIVGIEPAADMTVTVAVQQMREFTFVDDTGHYFTVADSASDVATAGDGLRGVSANVGYVDVGQDATALLDSTWSGTDYYRLATLTNATSAAFGIFELSTTVTVTSGSADLTVTATSVQMRKVTVPVNTGYFVDLSYGPATTVISADDGFRGVDTTTPANPFGYVDAGCMARFLVTPLFSAPDYYRILDIVADVSSLSGFTPDPFYVNVADVVVQPSADMTVTVTVQWMHKVTVPVGTGYTVGLTDVATLSTTGDGLRGVDETTDPANPFAYVDDGHSADITVMPVFDGMTGDYYRVLSITDTDYAGSYADVFVISAVSPSLNDVNDDVIVIVTVQQMHKVTIPVNTGYSVLLADIATSTTAIGSGFRGVDTTDPANPFAYVDSSMDAYFSVTPLFSAPDYYRILDITDTDYAGSYADVFVISAVWPYLDAVTADVTVVVTVQQMHKVTIPVDATYAVDMVTDTATSTDAAGDGFRGLDDSANDYFAYVDRNQVATFEVTTALANSGGYRILNVVSDNGSLGFLFDALMTSSSPLTTHLINADTLVTITTHKVHAIKVVEGDYAEGGSYQAVLVNPISANCINPSDGVRERASFSAADVWFVDDGYKGKFDFTADKGYRIKKIAANDGGAEIKYPWNQKVFQESYTVSANDNVLLTVDFHRFWLVAVTATPKDGGTAIQSDQYDEGMTIILIATASEGYEFVSWADGVTNAKRGVIVSAEASYVARFALMQFTITVTANNGGNAYGGGTYSYGDTLVISASPLSGYEFVRWSDGSTMSNRTVTADSDRTYNAEFRTAGDPIDGNYNDDDVTTVLIVLAVIALIGLVVAIIIVKKR